MSNQKNAGQQQDFQVILSKQDFDKLKTWQSKFHQEQKVSQNLKKEIQILKKNLQAQKKCTYIRKEEVNYLIGEIGLYCDSIIGASQIQRIGDIAKSYYQDLVDKKQEGVCTIIGYQIYEGFQDTHAKTFNRLAEVQKKFEWYKKQFEKMDNINKQRQKLDEEKSKKLVSVIDQLKDSNKFAKVDQDLMNDLIKDKNIALNKLKIIQKDFDQLVQQNLQFQREIKQLKNPKRKSTESTQKSHQIKLLIDQYYRELQKNLKQVEGLQRRQIQTVVQNQLKGIKQYIDMLIKKTFVAVKWS